MLGTNPVRHSEKDRNDGLLRVQDVFYTIQGEGPFAGMPAVFVRMAGCNLRCFFCDTEFDSHFESGVMRWHELAVKVIGAARSVTRLVVVTGGEPLLQRVDLLVRALPDGFHVQVETAGTVNPFPLSVLGPMMRDNRISFVLSPKTPKLDPTIAEAAFAYKYIIRCGDGFDPIDGIPITNTQDRAGTMAKLARPPENFPKHSIYLQPMDEQDEDKNKTNASLAAELCMKYGYHLSLQTHKLVGVP